MNNIKYKEFLLFNKGANMKYSFKYLLPIFSIFLLSYNISYGSNPTTTTTTTTTNPTTQKNPNSKVDNLGKVNVKDAVATLNQAQAPKNQNAKANKAASPQKPIDLDASVKNLNDNVERIKTEFDTQYGYINEQKEKIAKQAAQTESQRAGLIKQLNDMVASLSATSPSTAAAPVDPVQANTGDNTDHF